MPIPTKEELADLARANPKVWWEGYDAALRGDSAALCPYPPSNDARIHVWLSGHVTATCERETAQ